MFDRIWSSLGDMKALQIFVCFALFSSALAAADAGEINALITIRAYVPGIDYSWTNEKLAHVCEPGVKVKHITCTGDHVTKIDFLEVYSGALPIGTIGNITGLRFLKSLALGPYNRVPDLDAWYTQLPSLLSLSFSSLSSENPVPAFSANFTQLPLLTNFTYIDFNTEVLPRKIVGAPNLKALTISIPKLRDFDTDYLAGMNLTYLSFTSTGKNPHHLQDFPDFSHLTYLETLDLSFTSIRELPGNFTSLENLRFLKLDSCYSLAKIPSSISTCVKLEAISCDECKLNQADSLPNLSSTRLNLLRLPSNDITTVWPDGLCQLSPNPVAPGLTIDLSFNALADPPACFAKTTQLYSVAFQDPMFTSFPAFLANMRSLTSMTVKNAHHMAGGFPDLSGLPLVTLDLSHSNIVDTFPTTYLPTSLTTLRLNSNNLTGTIPDHTFAGLSSLSILDLGDNDLTGPFPSSIGMTKVTKLIAPNNAFTSLPDSIGQLSNLRVVDFHQNRLNSIPSDEVWAKIALLRLDLHNNRPLNGPLPIFWSKHGSNVTEVNLSGCSFSGNVPSLNSTSLSYLILSDNALDGIIMPSEFTGWIRTYKLDRNALTGTIPPSQGQQSFGGFPYLLEFDISFNRLTGSFPSTFQQIFEYGPISEFSFNNNGIEGPLPDFARAFRLTVFKGENTKVHLCNSNPNIRAEAKCTLNNVAFPGACGCESWYTSCTISNTTCPAPDFVAPIDPPGTAAPTPILPPGSDPLVPREGFPPSQEGVQVGSADSVSSSLGLFILTSFVGYLLL